MQVLPPYPKYSYFRRDLPFGPHCFEYLIDLCTLAYSPFSFIWEVLSPRVQRLIPLEGDQHQGILVQFKDTMVVVFRGTDNLHEWFQDFKALHNILGYETGFYEVATVFVQQLEQILPTLQFSGLVLTGHSLGAATAAIVAARLRRQYSIKSVVTFGQPRIGNVRAIQDLAGLDWIHFQHGSDLVCSLPPHALGYDHGGTPCLLSPQPRSLWTPWHWHAFASALDHVPTLYGDRIWGAHLVHASLTPAIPD